MSEYWKSLPRKFCDMCKCWFADNKASIEFHERGKRHQENVQKRIQEIQKKGIKQYKQQKKLEDDMEKIEKAALAAYEKDLQNMKQASAPEEKPAVVVKDNSQHRDAAVPSVKSKKKSGKTAEKTAPAEEPKKWYESVTEEGYSYYWNSETSESRWEPPEEGYVSVAEQTFEKEQKEEKSPVKLTVQETEIKVEEEEEKESSEEVSSSIGPQPRHDPYGQWVTVQKEEPVEIDLQLPKPSENIIEVVIPVARDEPKMKFKEKTIGKLEDTDCQEDVVFKKRKFNFGSKKNARQRTNDDD
ncbi:WW domain-binding protein 4-like [Uloborus diversus]|uniref:WW domain-binding protein 4-like n=1 Tax=Uloborus diversus TaxID=327109 RepID=UPI00240A29C4|nr:WW domain-binding protein 4-like [Uloborus diversus]